MFDIGLQEMLVIGVLALLVFGPSKLPELGRMIGRAMREFRRASDEFRSTVETNLRLNEEPVIAPPTTTTTEASPPATATLPAEAELADVGADAPPPAADAGEPFCAQRGARLFHRRECSWVVRVPEAERVYMKRLADANDLGFVRCPVCEPWEPA